ncbi:MAG: carbohydrate binding family 9 domain-containing protein [Acidimicrobiia bacterium]|nr:carbohydrate binding family 9 domain-containing protein [Acidimicrobiia bacterium]
MRGPLVVVGLLASCLLPPGGAVAQSDLPRIDGPAPPGGPAIMARDERGRATIRAVRLAAPLGIDGRLEEGVYSTIPALGDFLQREPVEGATATDRTEAWVLFDEDHVYVCGRVWETNPERRVANEMRRDNMVVLTGSDNISFIFDTFHDRRNAVTFTVNAIGGRADGQVTNERQYNGDFNPVWDVQVGSFEQGWTFEAAIPFKSLRYGPGSSQVWGFNMGREVRWKNESSYVVLMPKALGMRSIMQVSLAATLVGVEVPRASKNLEIKPYAVSDLTSDRTAAAGGTDDLGADAGVDVKYGVTQGLTADLTWNTDFAQVEADEQQINLTRFSLFFPEKREFFLENRGTFEFGGAGGGGPGFGGGGDTPTLFYSRRIGLHGGRAVPIRAGGRLTGRAGRYSLGLLNIQTGDDDQVGTTGTNFAVARLRRDILRRSSIGVLATKRSSRERGPGGNEAWGVDGTFGFFDTLTLNAYWARTRTEGLSGDETSWRGQVDYAGDRYGVQLEHLHVGDDFNPEVGFLRRDDIRRSFAQFRFSPRPRNSRVVRKYSGTGSITYIENVAGRRDLRELEGEFSVEFQNSDRLTASVSDTFEYLPAPFAVGGGVRLPARGYDYASVRVAHQFGLQRRMAGTLSLEHGTFYSGERTTLGASGGRVEVTPQFSLQPTMSINWIDLPEGRFTTNLIGSRVTYTLTPLMFVSALVQYSSGGNAVASNVRFRWEYQPGSELFVVYNEQRDTRTLGLPDLLNRAVIVKINRLFRF